MGLVLSSNRNFRSSVPFSNSDQQDWLIVMDTLIQVSQQSN